MQPSEALRDGPLNEAHFGPQSLAWGLCFRSPMPALNSSADPHFTVISLAAWLPN